MKNAIFTSSDEKYGDSLIHHWLRSLKENSDFKNSQKNKRRKICQKPNGCLNKNQAKNMATPVGKKNQNQARTRLEQN